MKQTLLLVTLMSAAALANAGVFKCANPAGGFTYSEKPCAKEAKALEFRAVAPMGTETPAAGNSNDKLLQQMNQEKRAQKLANEAKQEEAAKNASIQRQNICA